MATVIKNIEDIDLSTRVEMTQYEFIVKGGVRLYVFGADKKDAIRRFRAMTDNDVVFVMADELKAAEEAKPEAQEAVAA